jgi:anoctamin-10
VVLLPKFLAAYHSIAVRLTDWENHAVQSTYNASLTLKTFALGAIVAYLALGLSAFVYVPFGEDVMLWVQTWLFSGINAPGSMGAAVHDLLNGTIATFRVKQPDIQVAGVKRPISWDVDTTNLRGKLNPSRLREQMFAYAVTNQVVNSFLEIGLPFILRWAADFKNKRSQPSHTKVSGSPDSRDDLSTVNTPRKRVVFEDEQERGGLEERVFLDKVRSEAALPVYELFVDYNEMVVQLGYVVVWSSIWPLAGGGF